MNSNKIPILLVFSLLLAALHLPAQSLLQAVEDTVPVRQKISGAFKSTRVINAHSIEMLPSNNLDVRIMHRFGFLNSGIGQLFGLDNASMRMSFDYGITNDVTIGFGRSTFRKELDLFLKLRLLQQTSGSSPLPFTLVVAGGYLVVTEEAFTLPKPGFQDRSAYYVQLLAGRKFSPAFSLQLSPILVHSNQPFNAGDDKTIFAMGGGARLKVTKRVALTMDYHYPFGNLHASNTAPLSVGFDIETGGHVFQLQFSNATGMNERSYITQTTGKFFNGDIHFGFNLSRMFAIGKR